MHPVKEEGFLVSEPYLPFTVFINRNVNVRIHWHTYLEMLYVISGRAVITIDNERYHVVPGDFLIINSHEAHSSESVENIRTEILVIQFEPSVINPNLSSLFESKYIIPFLQKEAKYSKHIKLEQNCELKFLLSEMLEEFADKKPGYELNIKGNIYKAFSWLIRNNHILMSSEINIKTADMLRLKPLLEYLETNCSAEITNDTAARMT